MTATAQQQADAPAATATGRAQLGLDGGGAGDGPSSGDFQIDVATKAPEPQHMQALRKANEVRLARAELKRDVKLGTATATWVILECPWEAASMTIAELLLCQRGWGATRCYKLLASIGMTETKTIGSLTERQRRALAAMMQGTADASDLLLTPPMSRAHVQLRRQIKAGSLTVKEVLENRARQASGMTILDLLTSRHGYGPVGCGKFLKSIRIPDSTVVQSLSDCQRDAILAALDQGELRATTPSTTTVVAHCLSSVQQANQLIASGSPPANPPTTAPTPCTIGTATDAEIARMRRNGTSGPNVPEGVERRPDPGDHSGFPMTARPKRDRRAASLAA